MFKEIVKHYESEVNGRKICFVPCELSDKLLVVMAPHNQGERFTWVKKLVPNQQVNLLYINNPEDDYYDAKNNHEVYIKIIESFACKYPLKNVVLLGSSMSATAAIKIGLLMNISIFANGPQVGFDETVEFSIKSFPNKPKYKLIEDITRVRDDSAWIDLDLFIKKHDKPIPPIYLLFNHVRFDTRNAYRFINAVMLKAPGKLAFHHSSLIQHGFNISNAEDVREVYKVMNILNAMYDLKFSWEP